MSFFVDRLLAGLHYEDLHFLRELISEKIAELDAEASTID